MTVSVISLLKPVHVDRDNSQILVFFYCVIDNAFHMTIESFTVKKLCKLIGAVKVLHIYSVFMHLDDLSVVHKNGIQHKILKILRFKTRYHIAYRALLDKHGKEHDNVIL